MSLESETLVGAAAGYEWVLRRTCHAAPLFTFPKVAWERDLLPAAQIVPAPTATFDGFIDHPSGRLTLTDAPGATARIYGHGHARQWAWLHADLGNGDVLEIVSAVSTKPALRRLRPLTFLQLRRSGDTWPTPRQALVAPFALRATIGYPRWWVTGTVGDRRISVQVSQSPNETLDIRYTGPDGRNFLCRNSERATATIVTERRAAGSWVREHEWRLEKTAHSEVGIAEPERPVSTRGASAKAT
ncbi:hypothetical protein [Actinokineospora sp. HUAS TT18]|uniref:hypothetical protein n=1 Tax=Actinokineospora sp. HUAS TT18 TaxID=3447451 RepID=UPI003F520C19